MPKLNRSFLALLLILIVSGLLGVVFGQRVQSEQNDDADMQQDLRLASVEFTFSREPLTWRNALSRLVRMFSRRSADEALVLTDGTSYDESPE